MPRILLALLTFALLAGCLSTPAPETAVANPEPEHSHTDISADFDDDEELHALDVAIEDSWQRQPAPTVKAPTPAQVADVWQRVAMQLDFEIPDNKRISAQRRWYVSHPEYIQRVTKRAEPFIYHIVVELEKRKLPLELALLPIVESAFDPFAYSHGRASGMWQFVPGTGKRFGLKQNWWYDGRRDVVASTQAAMDYLEYLYKYFDGDWLHALAAYNSGEGRVARAIKKNKRQRKATDFWSLSLPKETRAYVPKLLALVDIIRNAEAYNVPWSTLPNSPLVNVVKTGSQIDLAYAAKLADMSVDDLHRLNPGYNRWATDPDGPHQLLLPIDKVDSFKTGLANTTEKDRLNWKRHRIKSGESLGLIAKRYHTTVKIIQSVNNLKGHNIRAGKYLLIPVSANDLSSYGMSSDQRLARKQNTNRGSVKLTHTVIKGDTLWDISRSYKVNHRSLAKWNGMAPTDTLRLGQELVIWKKATASGKSKSANAVMRTISYKVRPGDSLARIAQKFSVKIADLKRWNSKLAKSKYIQPGDKIKLYVDVTKVST